MVKPKRGARSRDAVLEDRNHRMREQAVLNLEWMAANERLWGAPLREQLEHWIATWTHFQEVVRDWDPVVVKSAPDRLRSATQLARCQLGYSGESQAIELGELTAEIDTFLDGQMGPLRVLNGAGLLGDWSVEQREWLGTCTALPESLMAAGARAEGDVRRVLEQTHLDSRLRARVDSLLARLAVTVLRNGGVLMKQRAHLLHTGRDRVPAKQLEKLMTPRGQWAKARFGTVDGDYLRASESGRRQAARLAELGVKPLGD